MQSSSHHIDTSTLSSMLVSPVPPSFLNTYSLCQLSDVRPYPSSLIFLSSTRELQQIEHFKNIPEYLTREAA